MKDSNKASKTAILALHLVGIVLGVVFLVQSIAAADWLITVGVGVVTAIILTSAFATYRRFRLRGHEEG